MICTLKQTGYVMYNTNIILILQTISLIAAKPRLANTAKLMIYFITDKEQQSILYAQFNPFCWNWNSPVGLPYNL